MHTTNGRLIAALALSLACASAYAATPVSYSQSVPQADPASDAGKSTPSTPYSFHLALLTADASKAEVTAALALAGTDAGAETPSADIESMAVLRVIPEDDLGSQVAEQLAAARATPRTERSGNVLGRRGVSAEIVLQPRKASDNPVSLAVASHASQAVGDSLQTIIRFRESDSTPTGMKIREQGEITTGLRYGDALVVQLKSGNLLAVAPGMFDHGLEDVAPAPITAEELDLLRESSSPEPVVEQGSGASIEWYTPFGSDVPDQGTLR